MFWKDIAQQKAMLFGKAYCSLRNEMGRNEMEMEICSLRNGNL